MKKLIVAIAALAMLTGSAYAAEWNFYGSARVNTFYVDTETENLPGGDLDETQFEMGLQSNARIGAKVKVSDELTGRFEYGTSAGDASIRLLYGEWNFGAGKLLVGQDYTPTYLPVSNQVYGTDNGMGGLGEFYGGREAQIKLTFGGFQIAIVELANTDVDGAVKGEAVIPRIEANYKLSMDTYNFGIAAGYQTFDTTAATNEESVDAYVIVARFGLDMGAFNAGVQAHMGQNIANMGGSIGFVAEDMGLEPVATWTGTEFEDTDSYGVELILGYTVNDMFGLEAGVGYTEAENDSVADDYEATTLYLQAPITMAPGVYVIPEIGYVDEEFGNIEAETTYFGAKWQINF